MTKKICSLCGKEKTILHDFYISNVEKNTYRGMCKECKKKKDAERKSKRDAHKKTATTSFYSLMHKEVCEMLQYDQITGIIYQHGNIIPTSISSGYVYIQVNGCTLKAHRLAYYIMCGSWPECIDHIDGNRSNNAWNNLRNVTTRKNSTNMKRHRIGHYVGASYHKNIHKWEARIQNKGNVIALGVYNTEKEAGIAYARYAIKHKLLSRDTFDFTDKELGI